MSYMAGIGYADKFWRDARDAFGLAQIVSRVESEVKRMSGCTEHVTNPKPSLSKISLRVKLTHKA